MKKNAIQHVHCHHEEPVTLSLAIDFINKEITRRAQRGIISGFD